MGMLIKCFDPFLKSIVKKKLQISMDWDFTPKLIYVGRVIKQLFHGCLVNSQNHSPSVSRTSRCTIVPSLRPWAIVHRAILGTLGLYFWLFTKQPWNNCIVAQRLTSWNMCRSMTYISWSSSAREPKKGMLPFILVRHMYAVLYRTTYRNCKQAVISK